jgi:hypothetical protein
LLQNSPIRSARSKGGEHQDVEEIGTVARAEGAQALFVPPMDGDVLRNLETEPARESDLDDVVRVLEAADGALGLPPEPIREELTWLWHLPTIDLERDTRILRESDAVIAYGEAIWKHPDEGRGRRRTRVGVYDGVLQLPASADRPWPRAEAIHPRHQNGVFARARDQVSVP